MSLRRIPSRRMHLQPDSAVPMNWPGQLKLAVVFMVMIALVGVCLALFAEKVGWFAIVLGVGLIGLIIGYGNHAVRERTRRIAAERVGESICTFVRRFDCRAFDTWILRAAYEQIYLYAEFPLRPEDRLADDLGIVDEDLDYLIKDVASLSGRSLESIENNPWFARVKTVADLCDFLMCQPCDQAVAA